MRMLKQSTTANLMVLMVDSSDHVTGKASLALTIAASKDGAAFASISSTVQDRGNGWYSLALTSSHTDTLGDLALHVTGTGADPSDLACRVVAVDHANAASFGLANLDAAVSTRSTYAGGAVASVTAPVVLAPNGLDQISVADPGGVVGMTTFPKMVVALWRRTFKRTVLTKTAVGVGNLKTYADDGTTVRTTSAWTDDGTTQSQEAAT